VGVKLGYPVMDGRRLRVFENRVLRRIFESKKEAVPRDRGNWHK
jgi:hypothetical protein